MKKIVVLLLLFVTCSVLLYARENVTNSKPVFRKSMVLDDVWLDVNRMNGVFRNNGIWDFDVVAGDWGLEWPKGSGLSPMYAAGQWVGAMIDGEVRVAGIQHSATEFQPGMITTIGDPAEYDNPRDSKYRWYSIKPGGQGDWVEWPFDQGAPFVDQNENGVYDMGETPMLIGDRTIFSVWNDLFEHSEYQTKALNVEVRQTAFAFNRADALGDMKFIKWMLVNKSGKDWESTYFSIWTDPDLGDAADDLVGCDSTLGLGYCWNATNVDQNYGTPPPAIGLDFFQGPIIDNPDSTVTLPNGTVLEGKEMLKMTSFVFYNNTDDAQNGNPQVGNDVWNYMKGNWRDGSRITEGERGTNPSNPPTNFMFSGDPESNTGWLDSEENDRRFLMTTGPFEMKAWDDSGLDGEPNTGDAGEGNGQADFGEIGVQEIVAGMLVTRGTSNLNSVTKLKEVDQLAQLAYDLNFNLAKAPLPPVVTQSQLPNEAILTWTELSEFNEDGSPYASVDPIVDQSLGQIISSDTVNNVIVEITDSDYNFYGYSVYQYSDASGADPALVDHWDVGSVADAVPYTGPRMIRLQVNKNAKVGVVGNPLINGKEYYFGVVAEGYLEFGAPKVLESPPAIVTVVPQVTPGLRYTSSYNDTLDVSHVLSPDAPDGLALSDGSTVVWVADPSKVTGMDYQVSFNDDQTWNLLAGSTVVADSVANQSGDNAYNVYDGLLVKVQGPSPGINTNIEGPFGDYPGYNGWNFSGTRWVSWGPNWGGQTWGGSVGNGVDFFGSDLGAADYVDVRIDWAGCTDRSDESARGLAAASMAEDPTRWSKAALYYRPGYAVQSVLADVPFAVYDTEANPPRRLKVAIVEQNDPDNGIVPNQLWDMMWDGTAFATGTDVREYIFILNDDYNDGDYSQYLDGTLDGTYNNSMYAIWPGPRGDQPYLDGTWEMEIYASNVNSTYDLFTFTAPAAVSLKTAYQKEDLKKINVVPNPYYGYQSGELDPYNRWVQFTNLPPKCTIRIVDLAGNLVRKLEKIDPAETLLKWDLNNEYSIPVASGIYIYHIDVPSLGEKIGKMAIFTPNERLDTW